MSEEFTSPGARSQKRVKVKGSSYFLLVIMAVMLLVVGSSLRMVYFKSKLLPIVVGSIVFILAAVELRKEACAVADLTSTGVGAAVTGEAQRRRLAYYSTAAWVLSFLVAIYLIGFLIAIPLFIVFYMKSHQLRWTTSVVFAVVTWAFVYGVFELAVGIELYRGLLFTMW